MQRRPASSVFIEFLTPRWLMGMAIVVAFAIFDGTAAGASDAVEPLVVVPDAPLVQMLVPGFTVRQLPIDLTNVNNLRYRADGQLYALGYNGDIWLLRDSNDDGVPDTSARFFENQSRLRNPIGMAVIPPGHILLANAAEKSRRSAAGVVVASKGKISAILDLDGDNVAEIERVIATGWQEIPVNVDACGVAIHPGDGAIYFALGTTAYNNPYLLDKSGKSAWDLRTERGTILRISPDLSQRSVVCTGVRFVIGMGFSADNELFVTDQEGATWLPNGNPFDELLHIRQGRHYGFPPRHPKHLPTVFDEPSLFDFSPQHQSTCGFVFNEPLAAGGKWLGPADWRGDLLVCGESRGKLYRTRLVRNQDGEFVARNQLVGCLGMLTVDCCLTPRGDLLVTCHSGGPDWGTGPAGKGKLFLIRYEQPNLPQPVAVVPASPQEVRVVFDRPLDPQQLQQFAAQTSITYGKYVAAADRFETIWPGYEITKMQRATPRYRLPIYAASITPDRKTMILATAPHRTAVEYALTLPGLGRESAPAVDGALPQDSQIDLAYSPRGVLATWQSRDKSQPDWSGWLPTLDVNVARALAESDTENSRVWQIMQQPGTLTFATQIDVRGLFYPAVQPGSKLDYERREDNWIRETAVRFCGSRAFSVKLPGTAAEQSSTLHDATHEVTLVVDREQLAPVSVTLRMETGGQQIAFGTSWVARLDDGHTRTGSLALRRFILPWAEIESPSSPPPVPRVIPELAGGNWGRGRRIFFSDDAGCAKCHLAPEGGSRIGPDLANLIHRDYESVSRDVTIPSFAINPDYVTYHAVLRDGRVLIGAVQQEGARLRIADKDGKVTTVPRAEVERLEPISQSIMPDGLVEKLGAQRLKDLLTFLLHEPPLMPRDARLPPPLQRKQSEVAAVLAGSATKLSGGPPAKPLHILLVAGKKDHGPGEHDYPAWLRAWSELLPAAEGVTVSTAMEWPSTAQLEAADTIVFFQKGSWNKERATAIDAHLARGRGLVYVHWAVEGGSEAAAFAQRIGLASQSGKIKFRHGPLDVSFPATPKHPIARNFDRVHFYDESYWLMDGDLPRIHVLASSVEEGEPRPLFWTCEHGAGRVFVSIPGHYSWTFDDPLFRALLLRGIAWSANESVDRLNDLVTLGVTLTD